MGVLQTSPARKGLSKQGGLVKPLMLSVLIVAGAGYAIYGDTHSNKGIEAGVTESGSKQAVHRIPDPLFGIDIDEGGIGIVTGYYGTVIARGGYQQSWEYRDSHTDELIRRVDVVSSSSIWAVGHRGSLMHSDDGGHQWQLAHQQSGIYLRDIAFATEQVGWAVGHDATILSTRDGGQTWQTQSLDGWTGRDKPRLHAVTVIDEQNAIIVGEFGAVAVTENGGELWSLIPGSKRATWTAADHANGRVIAVGLDGNALALELSTKQVEKVETDIKRHLFDVSLRSDGSGYLVGVAAILAINGTDITQPKVDSNVELPYTWLHGVKALENGGAVAVGAGGLMVEVDRASLAFSRVEYPSSAGRSVSLSSTNGGGN